MATKYRVEITKAAENDIEEIWLRIASDSIDNATRFVIQLEEKINTLEKMPERCPSVPENELLETDYRHLILENYRVVFRIARKSVWVLRVIHGNRLLDKSFFA